MLNIDCMETRVCSKTKESAATSVEVEKMAEIHMEIEEIIYMKIVV